MPDIAVPVEVADAVKAAFAVHDFGLPFELERSYADWDEELETAGELRVDVVPAGIGKVEQQTRDCLKYDVFVDVGVRQKFDPQEYEAGRVTNEQIDRLVLLLQDLHEHLVADHLEEYPAAAWKETGIGSWFVRKLLKDNRQFMGRVRILFEVTKDIP